MNTSSLPATAEQERLAALRDLHVLDSVPETVFDRIAMLAATICGAPIALISLVDEDRQWFKANVGLHGVSETPRETAFCAHAILGDAIFEIVDATQDPRFADNPLVTSEPHLRFYAGMPLVVEGGARIGTLCVLDHQSRRLDANQRAMLAGLADVASHALAMRRDLIQKSLSIRRKYERGLLERATHYRSIVESQAEFISQALPDGTLTYVNPAYARFFGLGPSEMMGRNLLDYVEPRERDAVRATIDQVLQTKKSFSSENSSVCADGGKRWVSWTNAAQVDSLGQVVLHSVGRDITDKKAVEDALRASQSFLRRTGKVAGVGGWELDLASGRVFWSEVTRDIHEVDRDFEPTLDTAIEFYAPAARAAIEGAVQEGMSHGTAWDLELPLVTAKGRPIWVRAVGEVEFEAGLPVRLVGAFQDVTERKALEHRIAEQSQTLSLVAESIPSTVAIVGVSGTYTFVNGAFSRACGRPRDQIIGLTAREVLGEAEFERRWPWMQRAFAGESVMFELDYQRREGTRYWSISYIPLLNGDGMNDGFVVVTNDVTSQRLESQRLVELSQRDPMTQLLNRAGLEVFLQAAVTDGRSEAMAILYVDLDNFKPVNDNYGHAAGDEVLRLFAKRLLSLVRPSDAVARLGGDEFAIALVALPGEETADLVAAKVLAAAQEAFRVGNHAIRVGASVGVAFGVDPTSGWMELVERADEMLLTAKAAGKGRHAR